KVETIELPIEVNADFVIPIYGDSMEPEYHSGDYVFVKLTYDLSDGDIGVFEYYGDAYIKQLVINDSGAFLHSLNSKYDDIPVDS
ncbi:S24 family peptidase, partial [Streptococcus suis]